MRPQVPVRAYDSWFGIRGRVGRMSDDHPDVDDDPMPTIITWSIWMRATRPKRDQRYGFTSLCIYGSPRWLQIDDPGLIEIDWAMRWIEDRELWRMGEVAGLRPETDGWA